MKFGGEIKQISKGSNCIQVKQNFKHGGENEAFSSSKIHVSVQLILIRYLCVKWLNLLQLWKSGRFHTHLSFVSETRRAFPSSRPKTAPVSNETASAKSSVYSKRLYTLYNTLYIQIG